MYNYAKFQDYPVTHVHDATFLAGGAHDHVNWISQMFHPIDGVSVPPGEGTDPPVNDPHGAMPVPPWSAGIVPHFVAAYTLEASEHRTAKGLSLIHI